MSPKEKPEIKAARQFHWHEIRRRRKKIGIGKRGRAKIPSPPNPLPFCPPERSVSAARSAAISRSFVQKRFELRSVIATKLDIESLRKTVESGANPNPTIETLTKIAKALEVGVDDLIK